MQLNAAQRLLLSKESPPDWWTSLTPEQKKDYIEQHPNSKFAKEHIESEKPRDEPESLESIAPEKRKEVASSLRAVSSKIVKQLKHGFPLFHEASSALKHLATGKKLTDEHKDALHELGGFALKTALSHSLGPHAAEVLGQIGGTAVRHAIEHFHEKRQKSKEKGDVEVFIDSIADGVEQANEEKKKPILSKETRQAIAKKVKGQASHIVKIIDKSYEDVKPAVSGLNALRKGEKLSDEQKKSLNNLGKVTVATAITLLPGGIAAHIGAGVGVAAVRYAFKAIRKGNISKEGILHTFVESVGEGLEDALLEAVAGD